MQKSETLYSDKTNSIRNILLDKSRKDFIEKHEITEFDFLNKDRNYSISPSGSRTNEIAYCTDIIFDANGKTEKWFYSDGTEGGYDAIGHAISIKRWEIIVLKKLSAAGIKIK